MDIQWHIVKLRACPSKSQNGYAKATIKSSYAESHTGIFERVKARV